MGRKVNRHHFTLKMIPLSSKGKPTKYQIQNSSYSNDEEEIEFPFYIMRLKK